MPVEQNDCRTPSQESEEPIELDWMETAERRKHSLIPEDELWLHRARSGHSSEEYTSDAWNTSSAVPVLVVRTSPPPPSVSHRMARGDASEQQNRAERIESLYEELDRLLERRRSGDDEAESEFEEKFEQLRTLQKREADEMRDAFEERLNMPLDAGRRALDEADALLNDSRDTDTSSDD